MRTLIIGAAATALMATSAMAAITTIEFKRDTGETVVVTLDGAGGATLADGAQTTYTYDADASKMCFATAEGDSCVVFETPSAEPKVGDSTRYTANDGAVGTATVTAITE